uniref:DUF679 domain-containing protein n=1 Tax=Oryza punctata TaxID=4537 RepID=A0A0E0JJ75_ORYPU
MAASPPGETVINMVSSTNGESSAVTTSIPPTMPKAVDDHTTVPDAAPKTVTDKDNKAMSPDPDPKTVTNKVMASTANLAQLLPTGTVLAYQALSPSFTNHGECNAANRWLTTVLVGVLAGVSLLFSFTDSVVGQDGKLYYGVATRRRLNVFNMSWEEEEAKKLSHSELSLRPLDFVHAFFTATVFLTVALSDVGLQNCLFGQNPSDNTKELLKNLPLGMAFLSSFVFLIFPTKRKGIGYNDNTPNRKAEDV